MYDAHAPIVQTTGPAMITLERRLVDQLEDLAQEALRAMEAVNAGAEELIYTDSSLSAAHATLEELRSMLANPSTANTPAKTRQSKRH